MDGKYPSYELFEDWSVFLKLCVGSEARKGKGKKKNTKLKTYEEVTIPCSFLLVNDERQA